MSRLIDADELIKCYTGSNGFDDKADYVSIKEMIKHQPTVRCDNCTDCWLKNEKEMTEKITKLSKLLEEAVEEIENLYGRETELSEEIRDLLN